MLNIRKGIKKLISYVMVFVLTVMVVGSAAVILSGTRMSSPRQKNL